MMTVSKKGKMSRGGTMAMYCRWSPLRCLQVLPVECMREDG
ncbi:MAG: hypothetical protein QUS07_07050 [Methanothrix sp.]|nr:hypothetical protein [Methanothrix sp.]